MLPFFVWLKLSFKSAFVSEEDHENFFTLCNSV